jgi:hypothetical protein
MCQAVCKICDDFSKPIWSRGLCHACYCFCAKLVAAGITTWEKIVASGYANPAFTEEVVTRLQQSIERARVTRHQRATVNG